MQQADFDRMIYQLRGLVETLENGEADDGYDTLVVEAIAQLLSMRPEIERLTRERDEARAEVLRWQQVAEDAAVASTKAAACEIVDAARGEQEKQDD
jgi:hypothetical protein